MAANEQLVDVGTKIRWTDSSGDEVLALQNLAFQTGVQGNIHDWGASPRPYRYHCKLRMSCNAGTTVGETILLVYLIEAGLDASETDPTNDDGDGVLSSRDKLSNLLFIGALTNDQNAAFTEYGKEFVFECFSRHFGIVVWNEIISAGLENVANLSYVDVWPTPDEVE